MAPLFILVIYALISTLTGNAVVRPIRRFFQRLVSTANPKIGYFLSKNPWLNKGHSFSNDEKDKLKLRGLYPCGEPLSLDTKVEVSMEQLRLKTSPLEKYIFLHTIQDSDETLFYAILARYTTEAMPIVYTPTVGEACIQWNKIYRHTPRGLYLSINDKGKIRSILNNFPNKDIKVIVFTDGERILGLGDLGANGMGIPVGKLALYTTCAGIHPDQCLPVHIDVGTENEKLLADPSYMGLRQRRVRGPEYDALIQEFFDACHSSYGRNVMMQFEDFGNANAFGLLAKHRSQATCFNDDIQGTASVVLAGIIASLKLTKKSKLSDHTYLFYGAGEAGVGIANLIVSAIKKQDGCSAAEARLHIWLFDSKGVVHADRTDDLVEHKKIFAHKLPSAIAGSDLLSAVQVLKPTALVGVSAQGSSFTQAVCKEMAKNSEAPLILALSNPTSKAECTAAQAYEWTNGKCVYFSGSPMEPYTMPDGRVIVPGQGNNAYIFPGVGLGAIAVEAQTITDEDFEVAATCLASLVSDERLQQGSAYPLVKDIRGVSLKIAAAVAYNALKQGRVSRRFARGNYSYDDVLKLCSDLMYVPEYKK